MWWPIYLYICSLIDHSFLFIQLFLEPQIDGLMQDCTSSIAQRLLIPHSYEKTLMCILPYEVPIFVHFSRTHQLYRVYLCVGWSVGCVDVSLLWIGTTMVTPYWLWLIGPVIHSSKYQNGRYLGITCNLKWVALYWLFQLYTSFDLGISLLVNGLVIL